MSVLIVNQNVNQIKKRPHSSFSSIDDKQTLKKQLMREIMCLELQISRMQLQHDGFSSSTVSTYEEMISTRKKMLSDLSL